MMVSTWPPALTIETGPVLRLFTGENFYSSSDAAIREAILNSIDAIGRRRETKKDLEQKIEVVFDRDDQTVSINDNGDGMDQTDVSGLFTKVGASASKLVLEHDTDYRAIGEFGIGALSYFLVSNRYQIHTKKDKHSSIGLEFSDLMLNGEESAKEISANRSEIGTTLILFIKSNDIFGLLEERFSHWVRNVQGLTARVLPEDKILPQGGLTREVRKINANPFPEWIEDANLGPPENLDIWDKYDGNARIDVHYRGVFVERIELERLWGLEGAIHVDPKHFRPKLNREGFVGNELKGELSPFLSAVHPLVLEEAVNCIRELFGSRGDWSLNKAITLWLAVPRSAEYAKAAEVWDAEFRSRKAFRLLTSSSEREVSIADLVKMNLEKIYLAPDQIDQSNPIISQAIRVLRARDETVIQGLQRANDYLVTASLNSNHTSWLLTHTFRDELPEIEAIQSVAEAIIDQESVAEIFNTQPMVKLVRLGDGASPFVAVRNEIWINIDTDNGRKIVEEMCKRNEGHLGLWVACMIFAGDQERLNEVGALLRKFHPNMERLGLVHRQYLRTLL